MNIKTTRRAGFTLLEIMIVVAIIAMLATIAFPNFVRARATAQTNACINNLRLIDGAKQQWALDTNKSANAVPTTGDLQAYLGRGDLGNWPTCPASGTYTVNNLLLPPTCTLSAQGHLLPP